MARITAVVPVLNEERALPALLARLVPEVDEVVVVDGGSTDGTVDTAHRAGVRVATAPRGRGPQLNAGAEVATGEILWFLHADCRIAPGVGAALRASTARWGCFAVAIDSGDPRLRLTGHLMTRRARRSGSCTGDMGIWARRGLFAELGGFAPLTAFEDLDFSDRARARAPAEVLGPPIATSARRWTREGVTRTMLRMWALRLGYRLGLDPASLARAYTTQPREPANA